MQKQKALVRLKLLSCKKATTMDVLPLTFKQERKNKVLRPECIAFVKSGLMTIKHCNIVGV